MARPQEHMVEIYALCCPRSHKVRYIGKAKDSEKRYSGHLKDSLRRDYPVNRWIRKLAIDGQFPILKVLEIVPQSEWQKVEKRIILEYRTYGDILNIADGGDEPFCSSETRAKNGSLISNSIHGDPFKKKIWTAKKNIGLALKKGWVTEDTKEKLRYCARKRPDLFGGWLNI